MPRDDPRGQLLGHAVERAAVERVLEPRQRRLRRQALTRNRVSVEQQLVHRVVGEAVAVVAVGMAAGDAEDALADQVHQRVPNLVRRPLVEQAPGERLDQTVDALGGLQQNRPAVGAGLLLLELAVQRLVEQIREQKVVTQGPPWWRKWLSTLHLYHTGALVSVPESEHAGRVDDWRGGGRRMGVAVSGGFRQGRCLTPRRGSVSSRRSSVGSRAGAPPVGRRWMLPQGSPHFTI